MLAAVPLVPVELRRQCWCPSQPMSSAMCFRATKTLRHRTNAFLAMVTDGVCFRFLFVIHVQPVNIPAPSEDAENCSFHASLRLLTGRSVRLQPSVCSAICSPRSIHMRPEIRLVTLRSMQHPFHLYLLPHFLISNLNPSADISTAYI
jgi:hypothetical protein